jgi:hypothetical protein
MTKIVESGSISKRHGSADPDPDPHQNVMDPQISSQFKFSTIFEEIILYLFPFTSDIQSMNNAYNLMCSILRTQNKGKEYTISKLFSFLSFIYYSKRKKYQIREKNRVTLRLLHIKVMEKS